MDERGPKNALQRMDSRGWREVLNHLNQALDSPELEERQQAWLLYWMGAVLERLGQLREALRSWRLAVSLSGETPAAGMIRQKTNGYGMPRQASSEMDDWRAFLAIQAGRYLRSRGGRFGSAAERDMVSDMIADGWLELKKQTSLGRMTVAEKKRLFRRIRLAFPFMTVQTMMEEGPGAPAREGREIPVDFRRRRPVGPQESCPCGSGLTYGRCCGRVSWPLGYF